ncbi:protein Spindly-like isoform X2 [Coccinella septempunctata]|uniref:protein Spindly-like isoform X2 n=1 Tax=Coccinella septempunctata TaxID=41139 RepID=UPI001D079F65|nr:protein Spindly-like isoform X2 [Coccinella septempunctata]
MDKLELPIGEKKEQSSPNSKAADSKCDMVLQIAQLREEKEQMKYEFKRKIGILEAQEKYYIDEIDHWKRQHDKIVGELKAQSNKFEKEKILLKNSRLEETSDLSEKISQLEADNKKLKKQLQDNQNITIEQNNDIDKVQRLEDEISDLKSKLFDLNVEFQSLEHKCHKMEESTMTLIKENQEYQQILDLKRKEVIKSNGIIMELQDEIRVLRKELDEIENQPRDINTRGNSLFAEVYDSRNRIREKFINLAAKYDRTIKEKERLDEEVDILRTEVSTLRQAFNEEMKNFRPGNLFELSGDRDSMSAMRSLVQSYKEEIDRLTKGEQPAERDYRYYEAVIQRQEKDIDKLRGILSDHSLTHAMRARKISEMGCQIAYWKSKASEIESEKRFLELKFKELENKLSDLEQAEATKSGENKENDKTTDNKLSENKLHKNKPNTDNVHENISKPKDNSQKSLTELYGTDKVKIITHEEIKAIMEKKLHLKKTAFKSGNKEDETLSAKIGEQNDVKEASKESPPNLPESNEDEETKRAVRFANDTKKEDGARRRPRGKNSYVLNLQTNVLEKIN